MLLNSKQNIIDTIKFYSTIVDRNDIDYSFDSLNTNNPFDFLLYIIETIVGSANIDEILNEILTKLTPTLNQSVKSIFFNILSKGIDENQKINPIFTNIPIEIPLSFIDKIGLFRDNNFIPDELNNLIYTSLKSPNIDVENTFFKLNFDIINQKIRVLLKNEFNLLTLIEDLLVNSNLVFLDKEITLKYLFNILFGSIFKLSTSDNKLNYSMINKISDNYINDVEKQFYKINLKTVLSDYDDLINKVGLDILVNCEVEQINVSQETINLVNNSESPVSVITEQISNVISNENVNKNIKKNLIKNILKSILIAILSDPKFNFILYIVSKLKTPDININPRIDIFYTEFSTFFTDIFDQISDIINCFLLNKVLAILKTLTKQVITKLLRERTENRINIINSLY